MLWTFRRRLTIFKWHHFVCFLNLSMRCFVLHLPHRCMLQMTLHNWGTGSHRDDTISHPGGCTRGPWSDLLMQKILQFNIFFNGILSGRLLLMTFVKLLPNTFCGLSQLSLDVDDLLINNLIALINHRFTYYVSLMHTLVP